MVSSFSRSYPLFPLPCQVLHRGLAQLQEQVFPLFPVCFHLHRIDWRDDRSTLSDSRDLNCIKRSTRAWMFLIPSTAWQALLAALSRHQRLQTAELLSMQLRSALIQHGEAEERGNGIGNDEVIDEHDANYWNDGRYESCNNCMFIARKPGVWLRKHRDKTCESTMWV